MDRELGRRIVAAHDTFDRALLNLRNATAMMTDDARAPQLLEEAGDAYQEALVNLRGVKLEAAPHPLRPAPGDYGPVEPPVPPVPADALTPPAAGGSAPGAEAPAGGGSAGQTIATPDPTGSPVFAPGKVAYIVAESARGAGFVVADDTIADSHVALRLTEDSFYGEPYAAGVTISVPAAALSLEAPADRTAGDGEAREPQVPEAP